jgi:outer membrane protein assembly factor BamB
MGLMRRTRTVLLLVVALAGALAAQQGSADWTQWRGSNRDGSIQSFSEPKAWPDQLTRKWTVEVGSGYATPLLVGDRLYVFSRQGGEEVMSALDAASGKVIWRTGYPASFTMHTGASRHGPGPKSTPVFTAGRLYAIGMTGIVSAYDAATGKRLWQKPGSEPLPLYTTHAFSPIVVGGLVVFHVGGHEKGALTAFDLNTGAEKWSWNGDGPGYGSPIVAEFGGTKQLVTITQGKLVSVDPATGALLWEHPWVSPNHTNAMTPTVAGDTLIVSSTHIPTTAIAVVRRDGRWAAETRWENADVPMRMSNPVMLGDMLFGFSTRNSGHYFGLDAKTGKTLWTTEGRQAVSAAILRAGERLFVLEDDGELIVGSATRSGFDQLRRYKVADTDTWTQPIVAGNRIYVKDVETLSLWTVE